MELFSEKWVNFNLIKGTKYAGRDVEAMKSIEVSVRQKSIQCLKDNIKKFEDGNLYLII